MMSPKEQYRAGMENQLVEMKISMLELEEFGRQRDSVTQSIYRDEMAKLRQQCESVSAKLLELKTATEQSWNVLMQEIETIFAALQKAFRYLKNQI
ncbi:hypothetical protein AAKU67_002782 [Oxalobacteraceae bacterium GrIS 2.11]